MQDRIEHLPIRALKPYGQNPRTHSRRQIRKIAKSIEQFGFVNPVLIGDDLTIIAGHGRVEAAKLLGLGKVPTLRLSHLNEAQRQAYVLADNRLALDAGWDRELLVLELQNLIDLGFEVELTGFETGEIDVLLEEAAEAEIDPGPEDQIPEIAIGPATSRSGDLWILGNHRLLCGDAREPSAYEVLLGGEHVDAVFTDPPYNVPIAGHVSGKGRIQHREFAMAVGEMSETEFVAFLKATLLPAATASRAGAVHFVCMDWRHSAELQAAGREIYSALLNLCVWTKTNGGMGSLYRSQHELIFVFRVGQTSHRNNVELGRHGRNRTNVWSYAGVNTFRAGRIEELATHPTVKPVALVADAIRDVTRHGEIVLDPFAGSGTTLIAAEKTGRCGRGIELDPFYVDVAIRRWEAYTGKSARLESSGASFEDVAAERNADVENFEPTDDVPSPSDGEQRP